jgi:hypothetical protein
MRWTLRVIGGLACFAAASPLASHPARACAPLPAPTFETRLDVFCAGLIDEFEERFVPGVLSNTFLGGAGPYGGLLVVYTGRAEALATQIAIAEGIGTNTTNCSAPHGGDMSFAEVSYTVGLEALLPGAPLDTPITVHAGVSLWAEATTANASSFAEADARAFVADTILAATCTAPDSCNGRRTISDTIAVETLASGFDVSVVARGSVAGIGSGAAMADPTFTIDAAQMVSVDGLPTPANQVFAVVYSPGIVPVPEGDPLALQGVALLSIAVLCWQRQRGRRARGTQAVSSPAGGRFSR